MINGFEYFKAESGVEIRHDAIILIDPTARDERIFITLQSRSVIELAGYDVDRFKSEFGFWKTVDKSRKA